MRTALILLGLLAIEPTQAATPIDGLYGSVFGSYSYLPDNVDILYNNRSTSLPTWPNSTYNPFNIRIGHLAYVNGYSGGGRFGYQSNHWRYEGEVSYMGSNARSFHASLFSVRSVKLRNVKGEFSSVFALANAYYDFPEIVPCVMPFLGAGLGYAWLHTSFHNLTNYFVLQNSFFANQVNTAYGIRYTGSGSTFAYQGTGGFTYNFSENYAINIAYRYLGASRVAAVGKSFRSHTASVGVIYRFNEYDYK